MGWRNGLTLRVGTVAVAVLVIGLALPGPGELGAQPSYSLYFDLRIPLVLPGLSVTDTEPQTPVIGGVIPPPGTATENVQTFYAGTFTGGTLGGVSVRGGNFRYGPGASKSAGGGTFSLTTDAGTINGQILMTTDGTRTTLLFFGMYLGARIEFSLTTQGMLIGGLGYAATGLAPTGFASHNDYVSAVQKAVASGPQAQQIVAAAETNARLVRDYQQQTH